MDNRYDKEKVYDEQISPLMTQIIQVCRDHKIQMLASFHLREEIGDPDLDDKPEHERDLVCSTYLQFDNVSFNKKIKHACSIIYQQPSFMSMMITTRPTNET